ncbi:MAG: FAD-dependent oxidoreductase [Bacteroidetes bacterium]|nr:FAD-dependent oxidoreductase [Bacteroidota bacterium]
MKQLQTQCCIAGGGPAGIMLGYLLARAGVDVIVLEKHKDFLRDFRGDTIHPSTMEVLYELGLLEDFLRLPHQKLYHLFVKFNDLHGRFVDLTHLPVHEPYIALMPQWDFLNFMTEKASEYSGFHLLREAEVTGLLSAGDEIQGVIARTPDGLLEVRASLTIGADGRSSAVRRLAGLEVIETGVPIDVLWLRIPKEKETRDETLGYFRDGRMMVLIDRDEYYQCGYIIPKGGYDAIRAQGMEQFREGIASLAPQTRAHVAAIRSWDDISLLTVQINHLVQWYRPGLLCIGDAAHAMSPAGGVGINLAIQDAVAAARILAPALSQGAPGIEVLAAVQKRREWPARMIQRIQEAIHNNFINAGEKQLSRNGRGRFFIWLMSHVPLLQRIPARVVGMGFRPERYMRL